MRTRDLNPNCTEQEHIDWVLEQQKYAGGFHHALIEAWRRADGENKRRIEEAFPYDYRIPMGKPQVESVSSKEDFLAKAIMNELAFVTIGSKAYNLPSPQKTGTLSQQWTYAKMKAQELLTNQN